MITSFQSFIWDLIFNFQPFSVSIPPMPKLTSWRRRLTKMTAVTLISTNSWSWWIQLHWGTEIPINVRRLIFSIIKQRLCLTAVFYCTFNTPFHFSLKCQIIKVSVNSYFIFRKMQAVDERESRLRTALQVIEIQIVLRFCNRICYHVYSLSGNGSSWENQTSHKLCHSLVWDSSSERFLQCCKIVNEGMNMSATGRVCFSLAFDDTAGPLLW